jgi:hypothetical protein
LPPSEAAIVLPSTYKPLPEVVFRQLFGPSSKKPLVGRK